MVVTMVIQVDHRPVDFQVARLPVLAIQVDRRRAVIQVHHRMEAVTVSQAVHRRRPVHHQPVIQVKDQATNTFHQPTNRQDPVATEDSIRNPVTHTKRRIECSVADKVTTKSLPYSR